MPSNTEPQLRSRMRTIVYALLATASCIAFYDTSARYDGFAIPQGDGVQHILPSEITFYCWYALWGSLAVAFATFSMMHTRIPERLLSALEKLVAQPRRAAIAVALLVAVLAVLFRGFALLGETVADDESVYLFEAQTLLQGRLVNPPPELAPFYKNQFIVINEHGWYGQYPIGHPLVLALGELLHARAVIMPLIGACSTWLLFLIGARLFDPKRAVLAACLLALSPQFVWTHGTLLSQPSCVFFILLGMWSLLQLQDTNRLRWAWLSGFAWGFAVLVRPMPGVLVVAAAALSYLVAQLRGGAKWPRLLLQLSAALPGLALGAAGIGLANYVQSGNPFVSGYETLQGGTGALSNRAGDISNSFGGALLRQNFWLLGWTLSFVFVPFARPRRNALLFWGVIAADYAYRLLVPKTVVGTTGPIYVFEAVPFLVLASVDGALALGRRFADFGVARARAWILALGVANSAIALALFVPVTMQAAAVGCAARMRVSELVEGAGADKALIFANQLVLPDRLLTWAYYPPNPSPALDDRFVFVRHPRKAGGPRTAYEFWMREFPDRRAFLYDDTKQGQLFYELTAGAPPPASLALEQLAQPRD